MTYPKWVVSACLLQSCCCSRSADLLLDMTTSVSHYNFYNKCDERNTRLLENSLTNKTENMEKACLVSRRFTSNTQDWQSQVRGLQASSALGSALRNNLTLRQIVTSFGDNRTYNWMYVRRCFIPEYAILKKASEFFSKKETKKLTAFWSRAIESELEAF